MKPKLIMGHLVKRELPIKTIITRYLPSFLQLY